jgi:hypothetical protein
MRRFVFGMALLSALGITAPARADVINAIDSGWYSAAGAHTSQNDNYITGELLGSERRSFVVFDLTAVVDEIVTASVHLYNPDNVTPGLRGYVSPDATETLALYDVTTAIDTLRLSQVDAVAIFTDLGSGAVLGGRTVSAADNGTTVSIVLNADGLAALNAARGGLFALGAGLTTLGSFGDEYVFGFAEAIGNPSVRELNFRTVPDVPEPATLSLLGLAIIGAIRSRARVRAPHASR